MPAVHPTAGSDVQSHPLGKKEGMTGEVCKGSAEGALRRSKWRWVQQLGGSRKAEPRAHLNKSGSDAPESFVENKGWMGALAWRQSCRGMAGGARLGGHSWGSGCCLPSYPAQGEGSRRRGSSSARQRWEPQMPATALSTCLNSKNNSQHHYFISKALCKQ